MTEQEAINALRLEGGLEITGKATRTIEFFEGLDAAISALEEIQKYRAIGTVEDIRRMQKYASLAKKHGTIGQAIDSCAEYEEIGTVEECRKAMERQKGKKCQIINGGISVCPVCDTKVLRCYDFCRDCGQAIDWSE